jgi:phage gp36-like protein
MSYCTISDLLAIPHGADLLAELAPNGAGSYDAAVVSAAIDKADGVIDDYLAGRYTVPVAPSAGIKTRAVAITWYLLFPQGRPDHIRQDYEDAIKYLTAVGEGRIPLAQDAGGAIEQPGSVDFDAPLRVFTSDTLRDF